MEASSMTGQWRCLAETGEPCRILEEVSLWGARLVTVWLPGSGVVLRVAPDALCLLDDASFGRSAEHIHYVAAAARIADALESDTLIAPIEGTVIPLPHQILALERAMQGDQTRFLLADEVGLGKTIEAGLIFREMKVRGQVKRVLVVAPAGLVSQWVSEMKTHFNESFHLVIPGTFSTWRQVAALDESENLWRLHDQVVCPLDSVKPVESRRGWSRDQLARYNRERFDDLVSAGWDLIIVDEAHRIAGSTEQVARFKLGDALSKAAPYLLLLSATPHQGKTDPFRRLVNFLDPDALPDEASVRRENVAPYLIRTEKRRAIDAQGKRLFKPRQTQLVSVSRDTRHESQRLLYDAVTEYVREGYNQALREKQTAVGFLMILMQRLVTSSTAAIRSALERRLETLEQPSSQLLLFSDDSGEDLLALDSQEQLEALLTARIRGLRNERSEVQLLLGAARRCENNGPDAKAEALLEWLRRLQQEEGDPELKVLIFTEFVATQHMLAAFLEERGFSTVRLNGSMGIEERQTVQRTFSADARVMVSTDAGGEGLNLQFCHVVVNYDLPWNPMKLEQRIGRVDRIGQAHVVRALNFALEDSVELRVREVLEEKLERILEEFGVDKLADVLDSEDAAVDFDGFYMGAVLSPEQAEAHADSLSEELRRRAMAAKEGQSLLTVTEDLDPAAAQKVAGHQMPFWTEQMTVAYLRSVAEDGGSAERDEVGYQLRWPDGHSVPRTVFSHGEAHLPGAVHLSIEDDHVHSLTQRLQHFVPGQPIAAARIAGVSEKVSGLWSLWRVGIRSGNHCHERIMPLFVTDEDRVLQPTARVVWDKLIEAGEDIRIVEQDWGAEEPQRAWDISRRAAEDHGGAMFSEQVARYKARNERERKKGELAFAARRRLIDRIGLPQVRSFRLAQLAREERAWRDAMTSSDQVLPSLSAVLILRVIRHGEGRA